ncbi:DUF1292 domain-containing protein [Sellimonas sp.]|uniref:DUF1292 domain-containing protein n=1 Tax=Sellimonas sp. TaxID=2021466 RepID=UPI00257B4F8E|nr:DUF1292 domain-containing protein [Sellimonas sp.]
MNTKESIIMDEQNVTVTLTLDNDEELECEVLTIYSVGEQEYIALLSLTEDGEANEDGEVYIYRYEEIDDEPSLSNIEDDDEYDAAAEAFDEWLDEQEFNEMLEDEEE